MNYLLMIFAMNEAKKENICSFIYLSFQVGGMSLRIMKRLWECNEANEENKHSTDG